MRHLISASLALSAACFGQGVTVHGLDHTPLGNAQLVAQGDDLLVTGLTGSGADGVATDVSGADFYNVSFMPDSPPLGPAPFVRIDALADVGAFVQPAISIASTNLGGAFGISIDALELQPISARVLGYLDDEVVLEAELPQIPDLGDIIITIPPFGCTVDPIWAMTDGLSFVEETSSVIDLERPGVVDVPSAFAASALVDRVMIVFEHVQPVGALDEVRVVGTGLQQFTVCAEQLGWKKHAHTAIGDVTLGINNGVLTVGGLGGQSGDEGVRIDIDPQLTGQDDNGIALELAPIGLGVPGQSLTLEATGPLANGQVSSLGSSTLQAVANGVVALADFAQFGFDLEARLVGSLQGTTVFDVVVPTTIPVGTFPGPIIIDDCRKLPPDPPCFFWGLDGTTLFDPAGATPPTPIDGLAILFAGSGEGVDGLASFSLLTNKPGSIQILDETTLYGNAFTDLGGALAGTNGAPQLTGDGTLVPGSDNALELTLALPNTPALLFYSLSAGAAPFKGGTLQTIPLLGSLLLATDGVGSITLPVTWIDVPQVTPVFQFAIADRGAVQGVALSNAIEGLSK